MSQSLSRMEILDKINSKRRIKSKLLLIVLILFALLTIVPIANYFIQVKLPYEKTALKVGQTNFTRENVVDFIRFNQRLSEEQGVNFDLGSSLFESLQLIAENEIAFLSAAEYGLVVDQWEIDEAFFIRLGFFNDFDIDTDEAQEAFNEKKLQFLNQIQLSEDSYQDIVRKGLFREKLRRELSREIPSIQLHKYIYEISLDEISQSMISEIQRNIDKGEDIDQIVKRYSVDPEASRGIGDLGWTPIGVYPSLDQTLFGSLQDNISSLSVKKLSDPFIDQENSLYKFYIIADISDSHELSEDHLDILSDQALISFFSMKSTEVNLEYGLDNETFNWINERVKIASILPEGNQDNVIIE